MGVFSMRVNSPIMSVDARGAFGPGVVFGKYCGTNVARTRIRTPIRRSAAEQGVKDRLTRGARAWGGLTDEQRSAWVVYAGTVDRVDVFGVIYHVTGQCEFMGNYTIRKMTGEAIREDPPEDDKPPNVRNFHTLLYPAQNQLLFTWDWWNGNEEYVEIMLTGQRKKGRGYYENQAVFRAFKKYPYIYYSHTVPKGKGSIGYKVRYISCHGKWGPWQTGSAYVYGWY